MPELISRQVTPGLPPPVKSPPPAKTHTSGWFHSLTRRTPAAGFRQGSNCGLSDLFPPQCGAPTRGLVLPPPPDRVLCGPDDTAPDATTACVNAVNEVVSSDADSANRDDSPVTGGESDVSTEPDNPDDNPATGGESDVSTEPDNPDDNPVTGGESDVSTEPDNTSVNGVCV